MTKKKLTPAQVHERIWARSCEAWRKAHPRSERMVETVRKVCTRCNELWDEETPGYDECGIPASTRFYRPCIGVLLINRCIACDEFEVA